MNIATKKPNKRNTRTKSATKSVTKTVTKPVAKPKPVMKDKVDLTDNYIYLLPDES